MAKTVTFFDVKKIEQATKQASKKAIADATAYLHTIAQRSVRKKSGKVEKHDLKIFLGQNADGTYHTEVDAKDYLSKREQKKRNERVVVRDSKRDVRNPQTQGKTRKKEASAAGAPPKSWKSDQKGMRDHWLREGILFDKEAGVVYVNPAWFDKGYGRSKTLPPLIEDGGQAVSHTKKLIGYYAHKTHYKNGKTTVSYIPIYERKTKRYRMQSRPFLKPALEKAAKQLLKILEGSIK
jgi:hypothetical protein